MPIIIEMWVGPVTAPVYCCDKIEPVIVLLKN